MEIFCTNCAKPHEVDPDFEEKLAAFAVKRGLKVGKGRFFCSSDCQTEWFERNERD